jgi:MFS transporter, FSR family, fosmidomycin resistance protein
MSSTSAAASAAPTTSPLAEDARTIGLVGIAHGTSHFFHMLLPPLFPVFIRDFGVSYSDLGLLVTLFFVISGIGQALSGFLVDKVGARPVLFAALACFVGAGLATAAAQSYAGLLLAAALAGLGNSPFHPVDFTILNKRVSPARLGHAFSVHGITGNLGWAVAPVFITLLMGVFGSWRWAALGAGLWALFVLALVWWNRELIDDRSPAAGSPAQVKAAQAPADEHPLAFLKLPSVWLCFSFFFWITVAYAAIQSFASPALHQLHSLPLTQTAFVVTGFMICGALGMLMGGFLANKAERLERVIAVCFVASAALLMLAATGWFGGLGSAALVVLSGLGPGLAGPSRDMLIKRAAPPGATGRVYGTVYSGLDVGFAMAAPVFGWMLDHGHAASIFSGAGLALLAGVASAALVGLRMRSPLPKPSAA